MNIAQITDPQFLKSLSYPELSDLCAQLRRFILRGVSRTGGHLSSNLGVVELTVALHRVFDVPHDKIIFDVGHQSYTHKILTGRAGRFSTLRQTGGLSGFQSMSESPADPYEGGHSSTSISAAAGFARARDMAGEDYSVIAVIGDGSIGNGLAYEALNHIGDYHGRLIIILNDNEMSISRNVGAMHNLLDRIRSDSRYSQTKTLTKSVLGSVPLIGNSLVRGAETVKDAAKSLYVKKGSVFHELGLEYYGPIDGHDLKELESYLTMVKNCETPVLLHVLTQKGRSYRFAEGDPDGSWHGVGAFDLATGQLRSTPGVTSYSQVVCDALTALSEQNDKISVITPAMASGSCLLGYQKAFPDRFFDVGIAEEHALVFANAMALAGRRPFVSIYSTFLQRGYDQIVHDVARMGGPVVVGVDRAGIVGGDGVSHQGVYDLPMLLPIPGVIAAQPRDGVQAGRMLAAAFAQERPFFLRYSKNPITPPRLDLTPLEIGSWERLREGGDCTILSYGDFVSGALEIAAQLEKNDGVNCAVVDARFLKPMDEVMLDALFRSGKPLFVYEESMATGSLGSVIALRLAQSGARCPFRVFAIGDRFVPHGSRADLLRLLGLDPAAVLQRIRETLREN